MHLPTKNSSKLPWPSFSLTRTVTWKHKCMHIYTDRYIYIYKKRLCVCICVCVNARKRSGQAREHRDSKQSQRIYLLRLSTRTSLETWRSLRFPLLPVRRRVVPLVHTGPEGTAKREKHMPHQAVLFWWDPAPPPLAPGVVTLFSELTPTTVILPKIFFFFLQWF